MEEGQNLGGTRVETSSNTRARDNVRSSMSRVAAFPGISVSVGGRSHQDQHQEVSIAVSTREVYPPPCKMAVVQCMRPWLCTVAMVQQAPTSSPGWLLGIPRPCIPGAIW